MLTAARQRPGTSLVELMVALTLASIVLGAALRTVLRQHWTSRRVAAHALTASQLAGISDVAPVLLAGGSLWADDLVAGEARDTSLQLRVPIGAGVACDSAAGAVTFSADDGDPLAPGGVATPPHASDSLWWYVEATGAWIGRRITAAAALSAGCPLTRQAAVAGWRLMIDRADSIPAGAPLRLTRQLRCAFYKSSDGWQLGMREWSDALHRFATPQPLAGPFAAPDGTTRGSGLRYFDAHGAELSAGALGADVTRVARIRITGVMASQTGLWGGDTTRVESADIVVAPTRP